MAAQLFPFTPTGTGCDQYVWTPDNPFKVPASLLRRLGEAADGVRTGTPVWFVVQKAHDPKKGHDIIGYFKSAAEACEKEAVRLISGEYLIFGPYVTPWDPDYHPNQLVKKVVLYLENADGTAAPPVCLDGATYDCVFWSLSAVDKFVVPYYTSHDAVEVGMEVRTQFKNPNAYSLIHIPGSEYATSVSSSDCTPLPESVHRVGLHLLSPNKQDKKAPDLSPV